MWTPSSRRKPEKTFASEREAYDCALNLLSFRDYSEQEMVDKLQTKGATKEQAEAALTKLLDYGLVDEKRYAQRVYEMWLNKRYYGRQHLLMELQKRSVKSKYITLILEQFTSELEEERAEAAAQQFLQKNRKKLEAEERDLQKILAAGGRFLAARGFSGRYVGLIRDLIKNAYN